MWSLAYSNDGANYKAQKEIARLRRMARLDLPEDEDSRRTIHNLGNGYLQLFYEYEPGSYTTMTVEVDRWGNLSSESKEGFWRTLRQDVGQ